jgi:hypothetical protein
MKTKTLLLVALVFLIFQSCKMENTPEEYFDITTLNTNIFFEFGSGDFKRMQQDKNGGQLMAFDDKNTFVAKSYEDHILRFKIPYLQQAIEKIKDLKPTDETAPMINASLDLFNFVKKKYQTDYLETARLLDQKVSQEEIDKAILKIDTDNAREFTRRYKKLRDLALPYAAKHGIQVKNF